jgi:ABC-type glycerol-3-phosphate transport system permease component
VDFFEVSVYLLIIVVAAICVFGIMWLLMRSMTPRRALTKKEIEILKAAGVKKIPKAVPVKAAKKEKGKGKDKDNHKDDKLLKLKELSDDKLLPENIQSAEKGSKKAGKSSREKDASPASHEPADTPQEEIAEIALPDLPTMDTLVEGEEETPEQQNIEELMSVFELEEVEDSATSDLAANLFDVDVENIEHLGNEVSEFLGGMHSK